MRKLIADTLALLIFSTAAGMFVEILASGMSLASSLQARITAIPIILVTGRPYGVYRDWLMRVARVHSGSFTRQTFTDILAFVTFQVPVYAAILLTAGATLQQIITACVSAVVILVISGRPYGLFLEFCRYVLRAS